MIIPGESTCPKEMCPRIVLRPYLVLTCLIILLASSFPVGARDLRSSILPDHIEAKFSSLVRTRLEDVSPAEKAVFWIFFEDKGVRNVEERRRILARIEEDLPLRTLERRAARGCRG